MQSAARAIAVDVDARSLDTVVVDPSRLRQVILNYLSNAIKFTPKGGRVTIRIQHERDGLLIEVSDTGPGIDPPDQSRIFDEFVQLPGRDRSGSGLGLAVSKLIVEAQGGQVGVRSIAGHGSTFWAWLPTALVDTPATHASAPLVQTPATQPSEPLVQTPATQPSEPLVQEPAAQPPGPPAQTPVAPPSEPLVGSPSGQTPLAPSPDPFAASSQPGAPPPRAGKRPERRRNLARR
jgi:anti-sigma regulatory factor (Ser/Thr protein kinase)